MPNHYCRIIVSVCLLTGILSQPAWAQSGQRSARSAEGQTGLQTTKSKASQPWKFEGRLHLEKGTNEGYIVLQVDLAKDHYIYSVSKDGSPAPTKIKVIPQPGVETIHDFSPDKDPIVIEKDPVFGRRIEKHKQRVQFFVPCRLDTKTDFAKVGLPNIEFNGQVCSQNGSCIPLRQHKIPVKFAGYYERETSQTANGASAVDSGSANSTKR